MGKALYETKFENALVIQFQQIQIDDIDISNEYISELPLKNLGKWQILVD